MISRRVLLVALAACCLVSCDRGEEVERARESEREAWHQAQFSREEASVAREEAVDERRRSRADQRRASMQTQHARIEGEQARLDRSGAIVMWVATAGALFLVILVLARERRLRRLLAAVLHRLFRWEEPDG